MVVCNERKSFQSQFPHTNVHPLNGSKYQFFFSPLSFVSEIRTVLCPWLSFIRFLFYKWILKQSSFFLLDVRSYFLRSIDFSSRGQIFIDSHSFFYTKLYLENKIFYLEDLLFQNKSLEYLDLGIFKYIKENMSLLMSSLLLIYNLLPSSLTEKKNYKIIS